ncbi:hypothetical protein KEM60_02887 [Austwickia sp. TVS 96-490-7B]|uniref:DUF1003 domain-containing protein n=1 Tax=Austwickia sp. TVS 96-490-7B TaxID=2830843 RepID=UPI001C574CB3|nr:DUF1003 domain-containing protein [Austwickia sp. TVS 96-490-7B]MBW3086658.1 hypothetical protein [Austwickia sp. TVS 96-490-7B]
MADPRRDPYRLDLPSESTRRTFRLGLPRLNGDQFGVFAERFARYMGTAKFLLWMTVFVVIWVTVNLVGIFGLQFDPYPFILLNLFFSTQASYAAPLILLAQNRQDDRDRVALEQDRARDERNLADTEYLTREVAALRIAMRDMATRDYLRSELRGLLEELATATTQPCQQCEKSRSEPIPVTPRKTKKHKRAHQRPRHHDDHNIILPAPATGRTPSADPLADQARAVLAGERPDDHVDERWSGKPPTGR